GDGAAAALLESDPSTDPDLASGILGFRLASVGELADSLVVPGGGSRQPASVEMVENRDQFLKMDGRTVFKWAVRLIPDIVKESVEQANLTMDDLKLLIFHQANQRILKAATEDLAIDPEKIFMNVDKYGNTSAASVAISVHEAVLNGQIQKGDHVLLAGFGAGLTWASCIFRW
ncbi:MAG: 3-oxoacyl-[acyl-carrier-protein] synthase III C-terminal domain-containing protein, partial [Planctomycetota bacterium]